LEGKKEEGRGEKGSVSVSQKTGFKETGGKRKERQKESAIACARGGRGGKEGRGGPGAEVSS